MRYVHQDGGLAIDKTVEDVLFQSWKVIGDLLPFPHSERVVAVGEDDGLQLLLVL